MPNVQPDCYYPRSKKPNEQRKQVHLSVTRTLSGLGPMERLASGAFGEVFKLTGSLQAFKKFKSEFLGTDIARFAEESVAFWQKLSPSEQAQLAEFAAWPTETVVDNGVTVGILMPLVTDDFFHRRVDNTGVAGKIINDLQWLFAEPAKLASRGFDVATLNSLSTKLLLLAKFIYTLAWLHKHGVTYGDINAMNFVFALDPPRVLMLDCDAVAVTPSSASAKQRNTLGYYPPEFERNKPAGHMVNSATDVWKAGMVMLRCLTPGQGATQRKPKHVRLLVGKAPPELVRVIADALSDRPSLRPAARLMYEELRQLVVSLTMPPEAQELHLDSAVCARGEDVRIVWRFSFADGLRIEAPNGQTFDVDPLVSPQGYSFAPQASGELFVQASNNFGTTRYSLGSVRLYELPQIDLRLHGFPAPRVPELPATVDETAWEALHSVGRLHQEIPGVDLSFELPDLSAPFDMLAQVTTGVERPDRLLIESMKSVRAAINEAGDDLRDRLSAATSKG